MSAKKIAPEIRAAVLADLHGGEQPAVVAERHGVNPASVRTWKNRYVTDETLFETNETTETPTETHSVVARPGVERRQSEIGRLVIDLLAAKLKASAAIAKATENTKWMGKQSASGLAEFGTWLDTTAFDIGDRLAGRREQPPTEPDE